MSSSLCPRCTWLPFIFLVLLTEGLLCLNALSSPVYSPPFTSLGIIPNLTFSNSHSKIGLTFIAPTNILGLDKWHGWVDKFMDGWIDGWMNSCLLVKYEPLSLKLYLCSCSHYIYSSHVPSCPGAWNRQCLAVEAFKKLQMAKIQRMRVGEGKGSGKKV